MSEIKQATDWHKCHICGEVDKRCVEFVTQNDRTFIVCAYCMERGQYLAGDFPSDDIFQNLEIEDGYKIIGIIKRKIND